VIFYFNSITGKYMATNNKNANEKHKNDFPKKFNSISLKAFTINNIPKKQASEVKNANIKFNNLHTSLQIM
jgi:hypothetical protein